MAKRLQLNPRKRPFLLCVAQSASADEVDNMMRDMLAVVSPRIERRDVEVRRVAPMKLGIDANLLRGLHDQLDR